MARRSRGAAALAPARLVLEARKLRDLRYGENPHQPAAWYAVGAGPGLGAATSSRARSCPTPTCSTSMRRSRIVLEFDEPAAAVIKHTNPCGVATGSRVAEAYVAARDADALSAFGGIVGLNRPLDAETATRRHATFIEAVVAPAVDDEARGAARRQAQPARGGHGHAAFRRAGSAGSRGEVRSVLGRPAGAGARRRVRGPRAVAARRRDAS